MATLDNPFDEAMTQGQLLAMLAGAASMCWSNPSGAGVFDSTLAGAFVDAALTRLGELQQ